MQLEVAPVEGALEQAPRGELQPDAVVLAGLAGVEDPQAEGDLLAVERRLTGEDAGLVVGLVRVDGRGPQLTRLQLGVQVAGDLPTLGLYPATTPRFERPRST